MAYWKFAQGKKVGHLQFKMVKARHRHHRYSAEEIMNAVMASSDSEQLNTDSDESDISEVESFQETFKTSSPDGPQLQEKENSNEIAVSPITHQIRKKCMWNCKLLCLQCHQNLTVPIVLRILFTWSSALIPRFYHHRIPVVTLLIQVQRATKVLPHFPLIGVLPTVPLQFSPRTNFHLLMMKATTH